MNCLFCRIITGEIPANIVFEDENFLAFRDLYPKAPVHVLVIPKQHIESLAHITAADQALLGEMTLLLKDLAHQLNLQEGFKITVNTGKSGGQEIMHLHYHLTGVPVNLTGQPGK